VAENAVLVLALALVLPAAVLVWRRPLLGLYGYVVGLALHNAVFMLLFTAGADGWQLTVAQAWKEILLATAIARVGRDASRARALPFRPGLVDAAALAFAATAVVYVVLPQDVLGGAAGPKAELYGLRHHVLPVAAFLAGRALAPGREELRRLVALAIWVAAAVAVVGLVEEYAVSLGAWRTLGAADYFRDQLDFGSYTGPGGLPENWVLNSSEGVFRRLVSTFLSPLGSAYLFVLALLVVAAGVLRGRLVPVASLAVFAALLFTFTRSALLALAGGLVVLALALRRPAPLAAAAAVVAVGIGFAAAFPSLAPETRFFPEDLAIQAQIAEEKGGLPEGNPVEVGFSDPSSKSHLAELERGADSLGGHLAGYGPGNSGQTALRFGVNSRAGESVYLELGADLGVAGLLFWVAFSALVLAGLLRRAWTAADTEERQLVAGLAAAGAALSAIAVLSDVWGNPWNTYVFWWLAGSALSLAPRREPAAAEAPAARLQRAHA
jgi:hypothetical protein